MKVAEKAGPSKVGNLIASLSLALSASSLLVLAAVYARFWWLAVCNPYSIAFEGHVLWASFWLSAGGNIYDPAALSREPWSVVIYPPLYFALGALLVKAFGAAYAPLRLVSIASACACAFFLYRLLAESGARPAARMAATALFLSFLPVFVYSMIARVDMLSLALSLAGLLCFAAGCRGSSPIFPSGRPAIFALVLTLVCLSMLSKYQAVVVALSLAIYLAVCGQAGQAARWALALSVALAVSGAAFQAISGGYFQHMRYLSGAAWSRETLLSNILGIGPDLYTLAIVCGTLIIGFAMGCRVQGALRLAAVLLLVSAVSALYTMGIPASSTNHLLFVIASLCYFSGLVLERMPAAAAGAVSLVAGLCAFNLAEMGAFLNRHTAASDGLSALLAGKATADAVVLSEEPKLVIDAGVKPAMIDPGTFMNVWTTEEKGVLIDRINRRRYAAIVINEKDSRSAGGMVRWPAEVIAAVHANYRVAGKTFGNTLELDIYLPKDAGGSAGTGKGLPD